MMVDRILRGVAGVFVLLSAVLAHFHSPHWLWFAGFVGLNLLQSAFTNWCPLMAILTACGLGAGKPCCAVSSPTAEESEGTEAGD